MLLRLSGLGNRGVYIFRFGGKSGHLRAECQLTAGRREPMDSAAENIPPFRESLIS